MRSDTPIVGQMFDVWSDLWRLTPPDICFHSEDSGTSFFKVDLGVIEKALQVEYNDGISR